MKKIYSVILLLAVMLSSCTKDETDIMTDDNSNAPALAKTRSDGSDMVEYELLPNPETGDVIGVDDFAYKKRNTYGTIIVNEKTHEPITLLDGRDGETLREWLKNNKQVKVVTRDRASAYARVIAEELPDAMQVADRFHLHQNLLEAIKKALNKEIPATLTIPHADEDSCKKNHS